MAEGISREDFETFMNEMRRTHSSMERIAKSVDKSGQTKKPKESSQKTQNKNYGPPPRDHRREGAARRLEQDLTRTSSNLTARMRDVAGGFGALGMATNGFRKSLGFATKGADEAAHSFKNMSGVLGASLGGLVAGMITGSMNLMGEYRKMADAGQMFEGSLFTMARTAAQAGMPLSEFTTMIRRSSVAVSHFGVKSLTEVTKGLRNVTHSAGMFGFSIEGLTEVATNYLEQQRMYGQRTAINTNEAIKNTRALAKGVAETSAAFGKSREEIMRVTQEAMSSFSLIGRTMGMSGSQLQTFATGVQASIQVLSGIQGEGGRLLSTMMADTFGSQQAIFSRGAEMFTQVGMAGVVDMTQRYSRKIEAVGANTEASADLTYEYIQNIRSEIERNGATLRILAMSGDSAAQQILQLAGNLGKVDRAQILRDQRDEENRNKLSKGLLALGSIYNSVMGNFLQGLLAPLEALDNDSPQKLMDFSEKLGKIAESAGTKLGKFMAAIDFEKVGKFVDAIANVGLKVLNADWSGIKKLGDAAINVANALMGVVGFAADIVNFASKFGAIPGLIAAGLMLSIPKLVGGLLMGGLKSFIGRFFPRAVSIQAAVVNVNGGLGGMGDYGVGRRPRGRPGRGRGRVRPPSGPINPAGRARRLAAGRMGAVGGMASMAATVAPSMTTAAPRGLASRASKVAGRMGILKAVGETVGGVLGKKIPLLGLGVAGALAASRLAEGDQRGAAMEGLSGAMSTVPVLGTLGSLGMDGALLARDVIGRERFDKFTDKYIDPMTVLSAVNPTAGTMLRGAKLLMPQDIARVTDAAVAATLREITGRDEDEDRRRQQLEEEQRSHNNKMSSLFEALLGENQQIRNNTKRSTTSLNVLRDDIEKRNRSS